MACECSEHEESSGTHCLVYTIGTEDTFYRMIEATFPPEPGPYGNPTVSRDGSLHFPGDHPDILDTIVPDLDHFVRVGRTANGASCPWTTLTVALRFKVSATTSCRTIT